MIKSKTYPTVISAMSYWWSQYHLYAAILFAKGTKIKREKSSFKCEFCNNSHSIPTEGFSINKRIKSALDIEMNSLKLNPLFDECKKSIIEARETAEKVDRFAKDADNFLYEYFRVQTASGHTKGTA